MIKFPLSDSAQFVIIEPGNIRRLKEGRPLQVDLPNGSSVMIAFTPDAAAFLKEMGLDPTLADMPRNQTKEVQNVQISPEQIQSALEKAAKWPEVER